ncbi:30879_t:CDS:1, partial [Racocetra persica]
QNYEVENVQLPSPSSFNIFQHLRPTHEFTLNLPTKYEFALSSPYLIFSLFFSSEQISTIVQNTNEYAYIKGAGEGRRWEKLTVGELKI